MNQDELKAEVAAIIAKDREYRQAEGLRMDGKRIWVRSPRGWFSYGPEHCA